MSISDRRLAKLLPLQAREIERRANKSKGKVWVTKKSRRDIRNQIIQLIENCIDGHIEPATTADAIMNLCIKNGQIVAIPTTEAIAKAAASPVIKEKDVFKVSVPDDWKKL